MLKQGGYPGKENDSKGRKEKTSMKGEKNNTLFKNSKSCEKKNDSTAAGKHWGRVRIDARGEEGLSML